MQFTKTTCFTLGILLTSLITLAQAKEDSPVYALDQINQQVQLVNQKYLNYMSEMAHGRKVKKAEKKHQEFLQQIDNSKYALVSIPYYKGDRSLHEGIKSYFTLISNLQRENYGKVVNMEEIAEQSYDAMEAYLLFKRKINERMEAAGEERKKTIEAYCAKHDITLQEAPATEMGNKMKKMDEVIEYQEMIYLIFFKASIHDDQLLDALNGNNVTAVEQIRNALKKYSEEGLQRLDTVKSFRGGDVTLKTTCKKALEFFSREADMMEAFTDFAMKEEAFKTLKKNFERNPKAQNDKAEIDKYNAAVADINKASQKLNQVNEQLNKQRSEVYKNFNDAVKRFYDSHMPYAK